MPAHEHDCDRCRYLGTAVLMLQVWDFYHCPQSELGGSIICRFSSDGPEYWSAPAKIAKQTANSDCFPHNIIFRYALSLAHV